MKRRNGLIATLAALFVLQAPLCVLACLPGDAPIDSSMAEHHEMPCHDPAPSSSPSEPANSHEDCGCEDTYAAVLVSADQTLSSLETSPVLGARAAEAVTEVLPIRLKAVQPRETDLPPPDILLLKSTLLI